MRKKSKRVFEASPGFVFRTPLLPYDAWVGWGADLSAPSAAAEDLDDAIRRDCDRLRGRLRQIVARPEVRDALFVASPDFYDSFALWLEQPDSQRGQKVERSLVKYVARMTGRATPFGLFAGVSAGRIGETTRLEIAERASYQRHTRLDNDYLFALAEDLQKDPELRALLRYRPNDSLYEAAGRLRYAEARLDGKLRSHHLVAVEPTEYLRATLERARAGALRAELAEALVADDPEIELEEALEFVDELIDSQILVSEIGPQVTGDEPIHGMLRLLRELPPTRETVETLGAAQASIEAIDAAGLGAEPGQYNAVARHLEALPTRVELKRLFQVDMVKPAPDATLGGRVFEEIERGIETLAGISGRGQDPMQRFREELVARYEDREVPIFEALDEEVGIGFEASRGPSAEASPLLAGLAFPPEQQDPQVPWSRRTTHLMARLHEALAKGARSIELRRADLEAMAPREPANLPDAFSCMPEVFAASHDDLEKGNFRVLLSGGGGPSGARISGRFCHASEAIHRGVLEHLRAEEALRPDAIFAELAHLPEGRIGNILFRPVLREYEIPYLGISGAPPDKLIPIEDLTVSVQRGRVVLRSRRLGREVIPRLSTAHNFSLRSLGIYRFLCTLQSQGTSGFGFGWGPLESAPFLPRVTCGRMIFSRARWNLVRDDLEPLAEAFKGSKKATRPDQIQALRARVFAAVQALRESRGLPRRVILADGDNELPVDLDNAISADSFAQMVKNRPGATLFEELPAADDLFAEGPEGRFVHQLSLAFVRTRDPIELPESKSSDRVIRRRLPPGSDWLYAKLYTGTSTADEVLRLVVGPVAREAMAAGLIDHWFFIRYGDPDWHVRVRMHGDPDVLQTRVAPMLHRAASGLIDQGMIWKLAHDTYERELARYGGPRGIDLVERLFWADSEAVSGIVDLLTGDEGMEARWRLAVRGTDMLLDDLGLDLEQKRAIMHRARESMGREFHVDAAFGKQLGARWKSERSSISQMLARDPAFDAAHDYQPGFELLDERSRRAAPICAELRQREVAGELTSPVEEMAWSYVHMHNNRLLRSVARAQELVIYDFLKRYYDEQWARRRTSKKKPKG